LYIDEFQNFASDSFETILSEARKYGLSLIMAHQTLAQISTELRSLILGNTGIQVYFRVNRQDAQLLAKEAFEYSGFEFKSSGSSGPRYWSLGEEWERHTEELQKLSPRACYVKHKIEGGLLSLHTAEIEPGRVMAGMDEEEFDYQLSRLSLGRKHLVERQSLLVADGKEEVVEEITEPVEEAERPKAAPKEARKAKIKAEPSTIEDERDEEKGRHELEPAERKLLEFISENPGKFVTQIYRELGLSGYKGDRLKAGLVERGLIVQKETRDGKRGRMAKVLEETGKAASPRRKPPAAGKGGDVHQRLQAVIREQAELYGWQAVVEERIARSLESVDVGLRRDDVRVAIEICSTTKAGHEMENVRKCLEAGYDYVVSVGSDDKSLQLLKAEARKVFSPRERERIRFYPPPRVKDFLRSLGFDGIVSEKAIVSGQFSRQKQLMDMNAAAEYLGISKNTLYEWVVQQKIPHTKVGRLTKFKREDLDAWLEKRTRQQRDRDFI
jgi:excisionase family DNA binding protein